LPMHYAASEGSVGAVRALCEEGLCDLGIKTFQGLSILHVAATDSRRQVVEYVLRRAPELAITPDTEGKLPVDMDMAEGERGRDPMVRKLLEAAASGDTQLLFSMMPDPDPDGQPLEKYEPPVMAADWDQLGSMRGGRAGFDSLKIDDDGESERVIDDDDPDATPRAADIEPEVEIPKEMELLNEAIEDGNLQRLSMLLAGGNVDVNSRTDREAAGDRLIHRMARTPGRVGFMEELLKAGGEVQTLNAMGMTALHVAAIEGIGDHMDWLLAHGADPSAADELGYIPLHYAAGEGHAAIVQKLSGLCDLGAQTLKGLNALHMAVASHKSAVVEFLLRRKPALSSMPDLEGQLPLHYAEAAGFKNDTIKRQLQAAASGSSLLVMVSTDKPTMGGVHE